MLRLSALYVHPVKSCRGIAVPTAAVDEFGLAGDRRFLVVDAAGRFLTQRTLPRMALIETALTAECLILSASSSDSVRVPLQPPTQNPERKTLNPEPITVTVWKDTVTADDCGDKPASWLSNFLGLPCRLVHAGAAYTRPIPPHKIPSPLALGPMPAHAVSFADAFPFLLISEESLADLNARLAAPLPIDRFRPNLVVSGAAPYAEDTWSRFRIGDVVFHGATRCSRCVVTTTDQVTAERAPEPLKTLASYRRDADGAVMFGRNLLHETKTGRLAVGDTVELL